MSGIEENDRLKAKLERVRDQLKCSLNMGGLKDSAEWAVNELTAIAEELEQYKRDAERMRDLLCRARAFVDQWDDDSQEFMDLCGDIDNAISQQAEVKP